MNLQPNKFMDADTGRVLSVSAIASVASATTILDWFLRFTISALTIWYLVIKIRRAKSAAKKDFLDEP